MVVRSTGTLRGLPALRTVHSLVWAVALLAAGTGACPNVSEEGGVDGTGYTCTDGADASTDACTTVGSLTDLTGTFATPERTGQALAAGGLSVTVKCATVTNHGITGLGTQQASVIGCYGDPAYLIEGLGAVVETGRLAHAECAASTCPCPTNMAQGATQSGLDMGTTYQVSAAVADDLDTDVDETAAEVRAACTCTCERYSCAMTKTHGNKKASITGGMQIATGHTEKEAGTCKFKTAGGASCSHGFLDGQTYTTYQKGMDVELKDATDKDWTSSLGGTAPSSKTSGVYSFANLQVTNLVIHTNELKVTYKLTGTSESISATYSDADSFKVYPTDFRFIQAAAGYPGTVTSNPEYTSACTYTVGNANANLGFYAIQLLDAAGNAIARVDHQSDDDKDFFTVNVKAVTGKNSASPLAVTGEPQDSSKVPSTGNFAALGKANLVVTLKGNDMTSTTDGSDTDDVVVAADAEDIVKMNANVGDKHSMRFQLNVADQVGNSYKLLLSSTAAWMSDNAGSTKTKEVLVGCSTTASSFRINAGEIKAAFGASQTLFSSQLFPRIVRADSTNNLDNYSSTLNVQGENGLPSPLHVLFRNTGGNILQHANCHQCVQARLLMCDDGLSAKSAYPRCSSLQQARCVTSNADGSKCANSNTGGAAFLDTLGGTTIVNMVNGTATFTDLKVHYVFGAGYRLQFMLNAGLNLDGTGTPNSQAYAPTTQMTSASVMVPDPSYSTDLDPTNAFAGVNNSFFVRPHHLHVYQNVGGDGVDLNNDDVPDGVGVGIVFRVQPAVILKGDGYDFNKNWNTHGWAPVSVLIKEASCTIASGVGNCAERDIVLYGRITKPVWHSSLFTASQSQAAVSSHFSDSAYYVKTDGNCEFPLKTLSECLAANKVLGMYGNVDADGTVDVDSLNNVQFPPYCFRTFNGKLQWNANTGGPTEFTHEHSSHPTTTVCRVHGESPQDEDERDTVQIKHMSTLGSRMGMLWQDLRVYTNDSESIWQGDIVPEFRVGPASTDSDAFTSVFGDRFDAFVAPDPPTNLRVTSYDDLGFRVEFEPSVVSRAQPLSGFIVEVDVCKQDSSNASCSTVRHPAYADDQRFTITSALGTDLSAGGGMTVDVLLNFTNPVPGQISPLEIFFTPELTLQIGDSIAMNLGRTFRMLSSFDATCTIEGPNGEQLNITNFDQENMVFHLTVIAGKLIATKPVYATLPVGCGITIPGDIANEQERSRFGIFVNPLPSILHAPILGDIQSRRFDNCKGTGVDFKSFDSSSGCDVTATYVLSTIQDASSMDTEWNGQLQTGGSGVACASNPLPGTSTPFPSNRLCSSYSAESRCKDIGGVYGSDGACGSGNAAKCSTTVPAPCNIKSSFFADASLSTMQNSGDNGKPVGSNPASGSSKGTILSDSDEKCRSGMGAKNPCALSVGQDWTLGVNTSYVWNNASYPQIGATFIRDRALAFRDIIEIKMPGIVNTQPEGGICGIFAEQGAKYGQGNNPEKNSTWGGNASFSNFESSSACETLRTEVYLNHTDKPSHAWESYWDVKRSIMSIVVGTPVSTGSKVEIFIHGFHSTTVPASADPTVDCESGTISCQASMEKIADVIRAQKTTIFFKNLATTSTYVTRWGDPVSAYVESSPPAGLTINAAAIYNFRVYAYNGRYKSKSVQTLVQNRAIKRPGKPLYFPQVSQERVPVELMLTNLAGTQESTSVAGVASPTAAEAGKATRIGVKFTPTRKINELETLDIHLPKFTGPGFLALNNYGASKMLLANSFQPQGSSDCQCDSAGRILTPAGNVTENRTYSCSCAQTLPDSVFQTASWSSFTEKLVLTVGQKKQLPANKVAIVWISASAGIKMPEDGSSPRKADGTAGLDAFFMRFKLNWLSQFPSSSTPRIGFIIQFTTDLFWKTNIQTIVVPDNLDQGVVSKEAVALLAETTPDDEELIQLSSPARFLNGRYIQVEDEIMKVLYANSTSPYLTVRRGEFSSPMAAHPVASGGDACSCASNFSSLGGDACRCNAVQLLVMGATDSSIGGGMDFKTGPVDGGCRMLSSQGATAAEGCNIKFYSEPTDYTFPSQIRTHQTAIISGRVTPSLNFATACTGTASTCTSGKCDCATPSLVSGGEFANQRPRGNVSVVSPGNVMEFPVDFRTRLALGAAGTGDVTILAVLDTDQLIKNYIRIGDEIMYVQEKSRAVLSVLPFKALGSAASGQSCSCSVDGTASGGGSCSCTGSQGANCAAGGSLVALGGGGQEFAATFTVANGKVSGITVVSPGFNYISAPTIKILSGGDGCSGVEFHVTLTDNALRVQRGQLGTSILAHSNNAIVNTVLWASQKDNARPGRRYNFRIAAYNSAGFSDFTYFEMKLYAVEPKVLPAAGGASLEIHLIGGGVSKEGYKVYIGRLATDGSVDLQKSKECTGLVNLDLAGTRMKCKAPAWVGGQFDLIVHYKSGSYEQIATGNSWIKYEPPEILSLTPAVLDTVPKMPVVVTVSGSNFGLDSDDLAGGLVGETLLPCKPLVLETDSKILCTLTPVTVEDRLVGDIVIRAGNSSFHGKAQETQPGPSSKLSAKPAPVTAKATIDADHEEITSSPQKREEFVASFVDDLVKAARVSDPSFSAAQVQVEALEKGSIIVVFSIIASTSSTGASPAAVALNLAEQAADPNSVLRQGTLTSSVKVSLPAGVEELASSKTSSASVPLYFSSCEPKTYTSGLDMKKCYQCCTYLCQTGNEVPQVHGTDVLPGFRSQICQRLCLTHCGYDREKEL